MTIKAMPIILFGRGERPPAAKVELPPEQLKTVAQRPGIGEWPEVARAILLFEASESEAWDRVVQIYLQKEKPFIVTETDVVARLEFLNQLAFQQNRFGFVAHHMNVQVVNGIDQGVEFEVPPHSPGGMKILADPPTQISCLAHANHRSEALLHQLDAGFVRQLAQLIPNLICHRHQLSMAERDGVCHSALLDCSERCIPGLATSDRKSTR